jgi:uncharacterized protein (TIGR02300 family)
MPSANISESSKAMRGTKRVCQACQVRFYDLAREEIVCPACGVLYTPVAVVAVEARRVAGGSGKTGWRQSFKRASPALSEAAAQVATPSEEAEVEVEAAGEEVAAADATAEDDIVLEQEADDADVSELVDVDIEEPKER